MPEEKCNTCGRPLRGDDGCRAGVWAHDYEATDCNGRPIEGDPARLLVATRAENKELRTALCRLLIYVELHKQQNPGWNGNRFDDERFARRLLGESDY